jgi:hypothetical protein
MTPIVRAGRAGYAPPVPDPAFAKRVGSLINDLGFRYYWASETAERGRELGLEVSTFYFLGRGGVLGDVEPPVVSAAFGYFNPEVLAAAWTAGRARVAPRVAGRAHLACCDAFGRKHLTGLEGLEELGAALEQVNDAASRALAGLPLYAGGLGEALPDDLPARTMRLVALLREHRGGVHLLAVVAAGMDPALAHYLRRPGMWRMFGWSEEDKPVVTDLDRRRLAEVDATTERLLAPAYEVIDETGRRAVLAGLRAAQACIGEDGRLPG